MNETKALIEAEEELIMEYAKTCLSYDAIKGIDSSSMNLIKMTMKVIDAANEQMLAQDRKIAELNSKLDEVLRELKKMRS